MPRRLTDHSPGAPEILELTARMRMSKRETLLPPYRSYTTFNSNESMAIVAVPDPAGCVVSREKFMVCEEPVSRSRVASEVEDVV